MSGYKILYSDWYSPNPRQCIGVVAIDSSPPGSTSVATWKCYIGIGDGFDQQGDEQRIARRGQKVEKAVACAYFPQLDPDKFTY